jgi:carboxymethylenebutenolidase
MTELPIQTRSIELHPETTKAHAHATIGAFEARPSDDSKIIGGVVIIQEIFGVNQHFKRLSEHYAKKGYWVICPTYFDHAEKDLVLPYDQSGVTKGVATVQEIGFDQMVLDTKCAGTELHKLMAAAMPGKKYGVGVVGFCLGGSLAWAVSAKTTGIFQAASAYYGGQVPEMKEMKPHNPIILHFGKKDDHIRLTGVDALRKIHPEIPVYLYDAGHGFNCEDKPEYNAAAAKLAEDRTLELFAKALNQ